MKNQICIAAIFSFAFSGSAFGQTYSGLTPRSDFQARASVTLPFGGEGRSVKSKPQFSLGLRSGTTGRRHHPEWMFKEAQIREVKIGLTLEARPSFLMNEQVLFVPDALHADETEKSGSLDTYDKTVLTVIGASLAVIAGSIIILADE